MPRKQKTGNKETFTGARRKRQYRSPKLRGANLMPPDPVPSHDEIFEYYRGRPCPGTENLFSVIERPLELYVRGGPDSEKLAKKIRKSQHVPEYLAAVD